MNDCKECKTPIDLAAKLNNTKDDEITSETEVKPIRELIGCLMYVMLGTVLILVHL